MDNLEQITIQLEEKTHLSEPRIVYIFRNENGQKTTKIINLARLSLNEKRALDKIKEVVNKLA